MATAADRLAIRQGLAPVFQRMVNAHESFIAELSEQFGLTEAEAEHVLAIFKQEKVVKLDVAMGRYGIVHGAYWDAEVMKNALAMEVKPAKKKHN